MRTWAASLNATMDMEPPADERSQAGSLNATTETALGASQPLTPQPVPALGEPGDGARHIQAPDVRTWDASLDATMDMEPPAHWRTQEGSLDATTETALGASQPLAPQPVPALGEP